MLQPVLGQATIPSDEWRREYQPSNTCHITDSTEFSDPSLQIKTIVAIMTTDTILHHKLQC